MCGCLSYLLSLLVFNYCLSVVTIFDVRSQTERIIEDVQALEKYMNFPMTEIMILLQVAAEWSP